MSLRTGKWAQKEIHELTRLYKAGVPRADICLRLNRSYESVNSAIVHHALKRDPIKTSFKEVKEPPPKFRPVQIRLPKLSRRPLSTADLLSLHWSDTHFPFQDEHAIEVLYRLAGLAKPDELYIQGDLIDFWQISDHRPPLEHTLKPEQIDIQDSLNAAAAHLATAQRESGAAKYFYLAGNHEDRWERLLTHIQRDSRIRYILGLQAIKDTLTLPYLLGLKNWEYRSYLASQPLVVRDRLVVTHGHRLGKWPSRMELEQYGKSVIHGHTHRIQSYTIRDLTGTNAAWNIGCLCSFDMHWTRQPDWHHGFALVSWRKIDHDWYFSIEQIRIHDGKAIWRDKVIRV